MKSPHRVALYSAALAAFERPLFLHALSITGGNQLRAARLLGINRNTLRKRLSDLTITADEAVHALSGLCYARPCTERGAVAEFSALPPQ